MIEEPRLLILLVNRMRLSLFPVDRMSLSILFPVQYIGRIFGGILSGGLNLKPVYITHKSTPAHSRQNKKNLKHFFFPLGKDGTVGVAKRNKDVESSGTLVGNFVGQTDCRLTVFGWRDVSIRLYCKLHV